MMREVLAQHKGALVTENIETLQRIFKPRRELLLAGLITAYATRNWIADRLDEPRPIRKTPIPPASLSGKSGKTQSVNDFIAKKMDAGKGQKTILPSPHSTQNDSPKRPGANRKALKIHEEDPLDVQNLIKNKIKTANPVPAAKRAKGKSHSAAEEPNHKNFTVPQGMVEKIKKQLSQIAEANHLTDRALWLQLGGETFGGSTASGKPEAASISGKDKKSKKGKKEKKSRSEKLPEVQEQVVQTDAELTRPKKKRKSYSEAPATQEEPIKDGNSSDGSGDGE